MQNAAFKRKFRFTLSTNGFYVDVPETFIRLDSRPSLESTNNTIKVTGFGIPNNPEFQAFLSTIFTQTKGQVLIKLYDGCACLLESWVLQNAQIVSINICDPDYSIEGKDLQCVIKYDSAEYVPLEISATSKTTHMPENLQKQTMIPLGTQPRKMGIGNLGNHNIIFKRKFRWWMSVNYGVDGIIEPMWVKLDKRPDESNQIVVSVISPSEKDNVNFYEWISEVFALEKDKQSNDPVLAQIDLHLVDGTGATMDHWVLEDAVPTVIDFGDLGFDSSDETEIKLTIAYKSAKLVYQHGLPQPNTGIDIVSKSGHQIKMNDTDGSYIKVPKGKKMEIHSSAGTSIYMSDKIPEVIKIEPFDLPTLEIKIPEMPDVPPFEFVPMKEGEVLNLPPLIFGPTQSILPETTVNDGIEAVPETQPPTGTDDDLRL